MIFDALHRADRYRNVSRRMAHAFDFLSRPDLPSLALGKHPIVGDDIFALIQEYQTKPLEQTKWEAHRKFIDVQYLAAGTERIDFARIEDLRLIQPYDAEHDFLLLEGHGNSLVLGANTFAVLFPHDAHRPTVMVEKPTRVRKIVVKVAVDEATPSA